MIETKRSYDTIEDAEKALDENVIAHCRRVEEYAAIIFNEAEARQYAQNDTKVQARLKQEYLPLLRKSAYYHDIGKAFVPPFYQKKRDDFDDAETALYQKHTEDSKKVSEMISVGDEQLTKIERRFIQEGIESHHEKWDGTGFPEGLKGKDIPLFARIIAIADTLDHIATEIVSEKPFDYAWSKMLEQFGTAFDPGMKDFISELKTKLGRVFKTHIDAAKYVPTEPTFVARKTKRPFRLTYRPIKNRDTDLIEALEAKIEVKIKQDFQPMETEDSFLKKEKLYYPLGRYALYEACDTINRLDRCGIKIKKIAINLPQTWFNKKGAYRTVLEALQDTRLEANRLEIIVTAESVAGKLATFIQNLTKLSEENIKVICRNVYPMFPESADLVETHISSVTLNRDSAEWLKTAEASAYIEQLQAKGIVIIADGLDREEDVKALDYFDVTLTEGNTVGEYVTEDKLIADGLALINEQQG